MKKKYLHFFSLIFFIVSFTTTRGTIDCVLTQIDNQMPHAIILTLRYNPELWRHLLYIPPTTMLSLTPEESNKTRIPDAITNGKIEISLQHTKTTFKIADLYCTKYAIPPRKDPNTHELLAQAMYEIKIFLGESPIYSYRQPLTDVIESESKSPHTKTPFIMTINSFGKIILRPIGKITSSSTNASSSTKSARTQSML